MKSKTHFNHQNKNYLLASTQEDSEVENAVIRLYNTWVENSYQTKPYMFGYRSNLASE